MRRVHRAGREVDEERLVGRERLLEADPLDGLRRHVVHEVVVGIVRGLDQVLVVVDGRRPLVGLAAHEAVELVEPLPVGPAGHRTGGRDLPHRCLVPLAVGRRAVAVQAQHRGDARDVVREHARGAGERRGDLGDLGLVAGVVVAARLQRLPRRRAERRRVELVVPQARAGELVEVRRRDDAAEGAGAAEPEVVDQDDHDVRRALRAP